MLQYKNNRFHCNGVSFAIPNGFYLNSMPGDTGDNTLHLVSPDNEYKMKMRVTARKETALAHLTRICGFMEYEMLEPLSPIMVNGIVGYHVSYCDEHYQYYEVNLDLPAGGLMEVLIEAREDILSITREPAIMEAVGSIQLD